MCSLTAGVLVAERIQKVLGVSVVGSENGIYKDSLGRQEHRDFFALPVESSFQ